MSFEVRERDLLARIGRFKTKSGTVETPLFLPVVNPAIQPISPKKMHDAFGCSALITNAYIVKKHFGKEAIDKGVHRLLDFDGVIMTDSGAYQILLYGGVKVTPEEIVQYQEQIDTDIATILDVPTGWTVSKQYARHTVNETMKRAKDLAEIKTRADIAWVGPIQGGQYLDLVALSARETGKLPFHVHALGSPTPVMEQYLFDTLVDMVMTAKMNLPIERPLHLFGAGHPFMFALAVALGCDLFDSAAYAIYAREDRYMMEHGTVRLKKLQYLPCSCPVCTVNDLESVRRMPKAKRQEKLAEHNLYVSLSEVKRIKQAIIAGRLWEHLEMRAHGHPALFKALKKLGKYSEYVEKNSPVVKRSGLFFFSSVGLNRPEIVRHRKRIKNYLSPREAKTLVLLPQTRNKPFHKSREQERLFREIRQKLNGKMNRVHICTYAAPFGVVPTELDEVYPLSQYEVTTPFDAEMKDYTAEQVASYIKATPHKKVILLKDTENWGETIYKACKKIGRRKGIKTTVLHSKNLWSKHMVENLVAVIQEAVE